MESEKSIQKLVWHVRREVDSVLYFFKGRARDSCSNKTGTAGRFYGSISEVVCRLKKLQKRLQTCVSVFEKNKKGILDRFEIIKPFLEVIRSAEVSGEVKNMTIQAVTRLILFGLFHSSHGACDERARTPQALFGVIETVAGCRYELSDACFDEVVLLNIVECLKVSLTSKCGHYLGDESVWAIVIVVFRVSIEDHRSQLLKNVATSALFEIMRNIFGRFDCVWEEEKAIKHRVNKVFAEEAVESVAKDRVDSIPDEKVHIEKNENDTGESYGLPVILKTLHLLVNLLCPGKNSLAARKRIGAKVMTSRIQKLSLQFLDLALNLCGRSLSQCATAMVLIKEDLCRYIVQMALASPDCLPDVLRVFGTLFLHLRHCLKIQIEIFFNAIYLRILSGSMKSAQSVELVLESLTNLGSIPVFWNEIYVNYDCDPKCSNVLENLCKFLSKNAFPIFLRTEKVHVLGYTQQLSLKCLINGLKFIAVRCGDQDLNSNYGDQKEDTSGAKKSKSLFSVLRSRRRQKQVLSKISQRFNEKPKHIVKVLKDSAILSDTMPEEAQAKLVSEFLRYNPILKKNAIGQFLASGENSFDILVREKYMTTFGFHNKPMLTALRTFLEAFRLPGEAQQIDRLLQSFANEAYLHSCDASLMATADVAYLLSFSIIMLNTDLHNPNIKPENKMSLSDFVKQNTNYGQEVSRGVDLPLDYLVGIYNSIKTNEIRKFEEGEDGIFLSMMSDSLWNDIVFRNNAGMKVAVVDGGRRYIQLSNSLECENVTPEFLACTYDVDLFRIFWGTAINALSVTFNTVSEGDELDLTLDGFILCAKIADAYHLVSVLHNIVQTLLRFSTLLDNNFDNTLSYGQKQPEVKGSRGENSEICASSVDNFGSNHKAQMAAIAAFGVVRKFGSSIHKSWISILQSFLRVRAMGLLPQLLANTANINVFSKAADDYFHSLADLCIRDPETKQKNTGFFYWIFGAKGHAKPSVLPDEMVPPLVEDVSGEKSLTSQANKGVLGNNAVSSDEKARRCIQSCHLSEFFTDTKMLNNDALVSMLESFIVVSISDVAIMNHVQPSHLETALSSESFASKAYFSRLLGSASFFRSSSNICFCIYWITETVLLNHDRFQLILDQVLDFLYQILKTQSEPSTVIKAACKAYLRLIVCLSHKIGAIDKLLRALLIFTDKRHLNGMDMPDYTIECLPSEKTLALLGYVGNAVLSLVKSNASNITAPSAWRDLFTMLKFFAGHKVCCRDGYSAVSFLLTDPHMRACVPLTVTSTVVLYACCKYGISEIPKKRKTPVMTFYCTDAIDLFYSLHERVCPLIERFSSVETLQDRSSSTTSMADHHPFDAWVDCWQPVLGAMVVCLDEKRISLKCHTISLIERCLLHSCGDFLSAIQWKCVFDDILFVILAKVHDQRQGYTNYVSSIAEDDALNVQNDGGKTNSITKTPCEKECTVKLASVTLVSKIFLHRLVMLSQLPEYSELWRKMLFYFQSYMRYGDEEVDIEYCELLFEVIKNTFFVVRQSGLLPVPDENIDEKKLWQSRHKLVQLFSSENFVPAPGVSLP